MDPSNDGASTTLTLTSGTLSGDIVMSGKADTVATVTKVSTFEAEAPSGYMWVDGESGTQTLAIAVASITRAGTTTSYASFADAVAAVGNGETITLLAGIETEKDPVRIDNGTTFVIDLNGHTLNDRLNIYSGFVTLKDTADTKGKMTGTVYVYGSGTSVEAGEYNKFVLDSTATIEKNSSNSYGIILYQTDTNKAYGSQIDIEGTVKGCVWVMGNITNGNSVINITGTVNATNIEDIGVALNGKATVNVSGDAVIRSMSPVSKNGTGIEVRAGTLNVTGGTITGTGTYAFNPNGSGTTSTGVGIAVAQHTTKNDINVSVDNGTVEGTVALAVANPQKNTEGNLSVAVSGGEFNSTEEGSGAVAVVLSEDETRVNGFISGGTFSSELAADWCADNWIPSDIDQSTGMYSVIEGHKINFNANGGNGDMDIQTVPKGESAQLTENEFSKENSVFKGWALTEDSEKAYDDKENVTPESDINLYAVWEEAIADNAGLQASGASLALEGKIILRIFTLPVANSTIDYVKLSLNGRTRTVKYNDPDVVSGDYKIFNMPVYAKEMSDDVVLTAYDSKDTKLKIRLNNGSLVDEYTYSVDKYTEKAPAGADYKPLVDTMSIYGDYAEYYFDNPESDVSMPGGNLTHIDYSDLDGYKAVVSEPLGWTGPEYVGGALALEEGTYIRVFFEADSVDGLTFTCGGQELNPVQYKTMYYVTIDNVAAKELDTMYEVKVTDGSNTYSVKYSALTYVRSVLKNDNPQTLRDVVTALYWYNCEANQYFK